MAQPSQPVSFDVREIPFSFRGSWLDISPTVTLHEVRDDLYLVSHQTRMHAVVAMIPVSGATRVETKVSATPSLLTWTARDGSMEATFESTSAIRLRGRGAALRLEDPASQLTPFTGSYLFQDPVDGSAVFTSYETGRRYRVTSIRGEIEVTGSQALGEHARFVTVGGPSEWEAVIEEFESARPPYRPQTSFDEATAASAANFGAFLDAVAPWRSERTPAAELAAYVLWSATVRPLGMLGRESMLMSKNWMDKVWSWDHCFNALALASGEPRAALDQFQVIFDHQDAAGGLPDSVAHSEVLYNFVKPPVHGWAFDKLRRQLPSGIPPDQLAEIYSGLSRWTRFWLDYRRVPGHELPHYQHGNDSGWDNSTAFDNDRLIESPDLAAFLILQLNTLASLAVELDAGEADYWLTARNAMRAALLDELWDGERFVAVSALDQRKSTTSSLLTVIPIVAAQWLPAEVNSRLVQHVTEHLTEFGPATELISSTEYHNDGYWRGPVWAPSTLLIEDGLRLAGQDQIANLVSERFRHLCETSGFAENFDALTGQGLRDRAYTWTASTYLILAGQAEARRAAASCSKFLSAPGA